jgi:hypothetical protein
MRDVVREISEGRSAEVAIVDALVVSSGGVPWPHCLELISSVYICICMEEVGDVPS